MSSVGYGNLIATTALGRWLTIVTIIVGAFLLSLLVAIITDWFILEENKEEAIKKIRSDQLAVQAVAKAFQYNTIRAKRYRLAIENPDNDHQPTIQEVSKAKEMMTKAVDAYRKELKRNQDDPS